MLLTIPDVLTPVQVQQCRAALDAADWVDGRVTAGYQGSRVKNNQQLSENSPTSHALGDLILASLERNPLFISAVLPSRVYPPLFNRYEGGQHFGDHIDNAIRLLPGTGAKIRTDVSATIFLSEPDEYDGGELLVEDTYGVHSVKLPAGQMIIYPSTSLHRVEAVTRGARVASFFWVQSMIRDEAQRTLLFDLDSAIQRLSQSNADGRAIAQLTGSYHNLLRMWSNP
ncbi:MAG: Fe2+-dependent dioxygenase [Pseudomonadota bacterium]